MYELIIRDKDTREGHILGIVLFKNADARLDTIDRIQNCIYNKSGYWTMDDIWDTIMESKFDFEVVNEVEEMFI